MSTLTGVISYPIPAYQNVPIDADFYQPSRFEIEDITLGRTTIVETSEDHNYVVGQLVRLIIPPSFGCIQLNEAQGYIIEIPSEIEVRLDIDSSVGVNQYIDSNNPVVVAQILAIGDINQGSINTNGRTDNQTFIPGSFRDISPQ
jgi:hypothetical protein